MINHFPYGNVLGRDHTHILSNTVYACRVKEVARNIRILPVICL